MENKFKPFDKVLVRDGDNDVWEANIYSHYSQTKTEYHHFCISEGFKQCIPYEGNECLLGTTNRPEQKRWRAEKDRHYWYVKSNGEVSKAIDHYYFTDTEYYKAGNYYRTEQEAKAAAERVRKAYKGE